MAKKFEELTISDDFMFCVVMQNSRFCKKVSGNNTWCENRKN